MAADGSKITKLSWVVAGGFAAWAAARISGVDRARGVEHPAAPLLSFTPYVAAAAPWAAFGLGLTRRRGPAATVVVAAGALGLAVRTRRIPRPQPRASGSLLRVLTVNAYFGRADMDVVVERARQLRVDVLFLQELTQDAVTRLKQAGLEDLMPHAQLDLRGGSRGSGIYSRFPLGEGPAVPPTRMAQPAALLKLPDGEMAELICVHPVSPHLWRPGTTQWSAELRVLPPPGERPRILAGDFNASLDHAVFRDLLALGYADAALQAGNALTPTWGPFRRGWAVLTLDHVLVTKGCAVLETSVHYIPGTDHRAVYAKIQLPGAVTASANA